MDLVVKRVDLVRLRDPMANYFNESELRDICFDLNVDYESLLGLGKRDNARGLVAFLDRRKQISELVSIVRRQRPKVAVSDLVIYSLNG